MLKTPTVSELLERIADLEEALGMHNVPLGRLRLALQLTKDRAKLINILRKRDGVVDIEFLMHVMYNLHERDRDVGAIRQMVSKLRRHLKQYQIYIHSHHGGPYAGGYYVDKDSRARLNRICQRGYL